MAIRFIGGLRDHGNHAYPDPKSESSPQLLIPLRRGDEVQMVMRHTKATTCGAGVMGVADLAGALLGPSPLLVSVAPLVAVAYMPFAIATAALGAPTGLAELGVGGKTAFVVWSTLLGAGAGRLIGAWCARWRARRTGCKHAK